MVSHHCKHAPRHLATAWHPCGPWFAQPPASPWPPKRLPTLEPLLTFDLLFALTSPHGKAPRPQGCSFGAIESMRCDAVIDPGTTACCPLPDYAQAAAMPTFEVIWPGGQNKVFCPMR